MSADALRMNPQAAMQSNSYHVKSIIQNQPAKCIIGSTALPGATYELTPMIAPNGNDYFYPFKHGAPLGATVDNSPVSPQNGTIVVTQPMTGCALEVVVKDGQYTFYHDANGKSMNLIQAQGGIGTTVCRITADAYYDDALAHSLIHANRTPMYHFICVYKGNFWHVGCYQNITDVSGSQVHGMRALNQGGISNNYAGVFNQTVRLMKTGQ